MYPLDEWRLCCAVRRAQEVRPRKDTEMRASAVECMHACRNHLGEATKMFEAKWGKGAVTRPARFIKRWAAAFKINRSLADKRRSGRPRKIPEQHAKAMVQNFVAGFQPQGSTNRLGFSSIAQGVRLSQLLGKYKEDLGVSNRTMMRSMRRARPSLKRRKEETSQPFTAEQMLRRLMDSKQLVSMPRHYFRRIVWIDAAKIWVHLDSKYVWVDTLARRRAGVLDKRAAGKRGEQVCLAYYLAVNYHLGTVHFELTAGTKGSGIKSVRAEKVCTQPCQVQCMHAIANGRLVHAFCYIPLTP